VQLHKRLIQFHNLPNHQALYVLTVEPKSPAAEAGLQQGDILISFNSHPIESVDDLFARLTAETIDSVQYLSVLRDKQRKVLEIYPAEVLQTTDMRKAIRKSAVPPFRNRATNHRSVIS
jgi:S1-C subfamily serine protease